MSQLGTERDEWINEHPKGLTVSPVNTRKGSVGGGNEWVYACKTLTVRLGCEQILLGDLTYMMHGCSLDVVKLRIATSCTKQRGLTTRKTNERKDKCIETDPPHRMSSDSRPNSPVDGLKRVACEGSNIETRIAWVRGDDEPV